MVDWLAMLSCLLIHGFEFECGSHVPKIELSLMIIFCIAFNSLVENSVQKLIFCKLCKLLILTFIFDMQLRWYSDTHTTKPKEMAHFMKVLKLFILRCQRLMVSVHNSKVHNCTLVLKMFIMKESIPPDCPQYKELWRRAILNFCNAIMFKAMD